MEVWMEEVAMEVWMEEVAMEVWMEEVMEMVEAVAAVHYYEC
jgi:hypothetical protein